jgi:hypothetical protein
MLQQGLDTSMNGSGLHRPIGIAKHPHDGPLDHAVAMTPLRRLRLHLDLGLESNRRQVQNGLKPWRGV